MPLPLADRIALVTGASRGIGYATALALAKAGAHVVAVARTVGGLEELDDAIKAAGGTATLVPLDLKDYDGIDRLGARAARALRPARRAGRQCRHPRTAVPARPCRAEGLGRGDGGQRHRQLAAHPRHGPAAEVLRRRARRVRLLGRRRAWRAPIGAPTPSPRRRSKRWRAPMRRKPRRPMCASICSTPGRCARACARRRCRAKTR